MIIHVCDRCGRKLSEDKVKTTNHQYMVKPYLQPVEFNPVELCEGCLKDLDKFMKGQTVFAYGDDTAISNQTH